MENEIVESQPRQVVAHQVSDSATLMSAIAQAAANPNTDVEKMERLWAMHEKIAARDSERAFNDAMSAAQSSMGRIAADSENPQTRSAYASYAQLDRHVRPIYTKNGFSLSFNTGDSGKENELRVICYVSHAAGHTRTYTVDMPSDGKGAKGGDVMTKTHATGSAMSYGSRYLLKAIFNIAVGEGDDDGNKAGSDGKENAKLQAGRDAAMQGLAELTLWWQGLSKREQQSMNSEFGGLRVAARRADEGRGA